MKAIWDSFCHNLNKEDYEKAFLMKGELLNEGANADDLDLKVNTHELYEKSFQFPDIAHFDYASE